MSDPLLVDVTAVIRDLLNERLNGVRVVTELPSNLADVLPVVRVVRTGGGDDRHVLDEPMLTLHAYDADERSTRQLCYQLGAVLREATGALYSGAVITRLDKLGGPMWAGYENVGVRHQVVIYQMRIKAA